MITIRQQVEQFLNFEGVNKAWVAGQLYGKHGKASTAKLHNKLLGVENRNFTDEEIEKLIAIRKYFLEQLI